MRPVRSRPPTKTFSKCNFITTTIITTTTTTTTTTAGDAITATIMMHLVSSSFPGTGTVIITITTIIITTAFIAATIEGGTAGIFQDLEIGPFEALFSLHDVLGVMFLAQTA